MFPYKFKPTIFSDIYIYTYICIHISLDEMNLYLLKGFVCLFHFLAFQLRIRIYFELILYILWNKEQSPLSNTYLRQKLNYSKAVQKLFFPFTELVFLLILHLTRTYESMLLFSLCSKYLLYLDNYHSIISSLSPIIFSFI